MEQINNMGGPNAPYDHGNPNQQQVNVNASGGPQQPMLVNTMSQQRVPPNMVMQESRPGGPIGTNIGLGNVGNDAGIITSQAQTPNQALEVVQPRTQAPPQQNVAGVSQQPNPSTGQQTPNQSVGIDKKNQIQQQLMLLLHAYKCTRQENENPNNSMKCPVVHCKTMKDILVHMSNCKSNKDCSFPHCISSRQILLHWKNCSRQDCAICLPFKQTDKYRQPGANATNTGGPAPNAQVGGNVNIATNTVTGSASPNTMNAKPNQEMNQSQGQEIRRFDTLAMQGSVSSALNILPANSLSPQVTQGMQMTGPSVRVIVPNQGVPQRGNQLMSGGNVVSIGQQQGGQQPNLSAKLASVAGQITQQQQQGNISQSVNVQMFNTNNADGKVLQRSQLSQMKMSGVGLPTGQMSSVSESGTSKDWHCTVTTDLRNHLVQRLVQAIFPTSDPATMMDKRMSHLVSFAEKVERDVYEMANSRSEYYHLLAEKIYKIQKELEEKRQKRKEQQLLLQQQQQQ